MNKEITVTLTQEEADAVYSQLIGRLDFFDGLIKEEGKKNNPNANRIIELANSKQKIENAVNKLFAAGATLWC